jgi:AAA domain
MMRRVVLTDDAAIIAALQASNVTAYDLATEAMPDLRDAEVIVLGKPGMAKAGALSLVARGVSDCNVHYADITNPAAAYAALTKPRHLHWDDARPLADISAPVDFPTFECGLPFLDTNLKWRETELDLMAGAYGSGKSILAQMLGLRFLITHGEKLGCTALFCSWEDNEGEIKRNVQAHADFYRIDGSRLIRDIHAVVRPASEDRFIGWYMNLVRYYARKFNTKFFVCDPWNEFDHQKIRGQSETEYVLDIMKDFRRLVDELKIIMLIVTHVGANLSRVTAP